MKYMLQHSKLENAYFQNIIARISKNFTANRMSGTESLNESIVRFLDISYDNFKRVYDYTQRSTSVDAETKGLISGIESVISEGVGRYFANHGYIATIPDGLSEIDAYRVAVEAIKDEFEGTSEEDSDVSVSENGDTNSAVIQAIIEDLKNRQASDVGKTVNLILKLNADKQKEMLDEEKENSEEIDETMNDTDLTGDGSGDDADTEGELDDGENPLDANAEENPEGEDENLEDDSGDDVDAKADAAMNEPKDGGKSDKKASKDGKADSFGENPFGGFESFEERHILNGSNIFEAGLEEDAKIKMIKLASGVTIPLGVEGSVTLFDEFIRRVQLEPKISGFLFGGDTSVTPEDFNNAIRSSIWETLKGNWKTLAFNTFALILARQFGKKLANWRPTEKNILEHKAFGKTYKDKIYMQPKQYEKAKANMIKVSEDIAKSLISNVSKHEFMKAFAAKAKEENIEFKAGKVFKPAMEVDGYTAVGYVTSVPVMLVTSISKNTDKSKKELKAMSERLMNDIFTANISKVREQIEKINEKHPGFKLEVFTSKSKQFDGFIFVGFRSNVVVSQVFTESEARDFLEGIAEGLNEYDPQEAMMFINGLESDNPFVSASNLSLDDLEDGTEAVFTAALAKSMAVAGTTSFLMEKLMNFRAGENIFRKSVKMDPNVYNDNIKQMESSIASNMAYLEGIIRGINKFTTWLVDVGAIKVMKKPEFVDGIAVVIAFDAVHPITIDKENKQLVYRNSKIALADVGVSKFGMMPFKNLSAQLVKTSKEINSRLSQILKQKLGDNPLYGGINPIRIPDGESGWGVVAYKRKEEKVSKVPATESEVSNIEEYLTEVPETGVESVFYDIETGLSEGTEGLIGNIKSKFRSISLLRSEIEMDPNEYKSFANEFSNYAKEALDSLLVDIKNDNEIGLLGLGRFIDTKDHPVTMDNKNRPQVLIYKATNGLIPASYWKQFEAEFNGSVPIKSQNAKYDKLVKVIKRALETFINTTKFKGMVVFPKLSSDLSTAYAVIANPVKLKVNVAPAGESVEFAFITGEYKGHPVYGTESVMSDYMNSDYKAYNILLGLSKSALNIKSELESLISVDGALESVYKAIGNCIDYESGLESMKCIRESTVKMHLAKLNLEGTKTSVLFRNTMLEKLYDAAVTTLSKVVPNAKEIISINGNTNAIEMIVPVVSPKLAIGIEGYNIMKALCNDYFKADYDREVAIENAKPMLFGIESLETDKAMYSFDTMTAIYTQMIRKGLDKRRAEYYVNSLFGVESRSVDDLSVYLGGIESEELQVLKDRASILNTSYMNKLGRNLGKYAPVAIYEQTKTLMQESLDLHENQIRYFKDHGLIIGLESGDEIELAKAMIKRCNNLPDFTYFDIIKYGNNAMQNAYIIPIDLGIESTSDLRTILKTYKERLEEINLTSNIHSLSDIKVRNILGQLVQPFAGLESTLESHVLKMNDDARINKLEEAYNMFGVESVEYKQILENHKKLTLSSYNSYTAVILTASLFGLPYNKSKIYTFNEI